jgi:hypothetical protein
VIKKTDKQLRSWVSLQKRLWKEGKLSDEQMSKLTKAGFDPEPSRTDWTDEQLLAAARAFKTRGKWQRQGRRTYAAARFRGKEFFEKCCAHMEILQSDWTDAAIIADAKKYKTRSEWKLATSAYSAARKRGQQFLDRCCAHMERVLQDWSSDSAVLKDAKKYKTRSEWANASGGSGAYAVARLRGKEFFEKCCAHMPHPRNVRVTDQQILATATSFSTRAEWNKAMPGMVQSARERGRAFFERCCAHMPPPLRKHTDEELLAIARTYRTIAAWTEGRGGAALAARNRGKEFFAKCVAHMERMRALDWTDETLLAEAKKYKTRSEWANANGGAYNAARNRGEDFFAKCCALMKQLRTDWTDEALLAEAKKYKTRTEWYKRKGAAYAAARRRGEDFFAKCSAHMEKVHAEWTDEAVLAEAKKYKTRTEWHKLNGGASNAARQRGKEFFEKCCAHMGKKS